VTIAQGGVLPNIQAVLLPKKTESHKSQTKWLLHKTATISLKQKGSFQSHLHFHEKLCMTGIINDGQFQTSFGPLPAVNTDSILRPSVAKY
jgi:hypothetical protein